LLWHPLLYKAIANGFHPTTHKVSPWSSKVIILPKTRTSCFSHHTTWISPLYVRLTDSLEFHDATLLESLSNYIHYNTTMNSRQETHGITSSSYHIHVPTRSTWNLKTSHFHANAPPTNQSIVHFMLSTKYNSLIPSHLNIHNIIPQAIKRINHTIMEVDIHLNNSVVNLAQAKEFWFKRQESIVQAKSFRLSEIAIREHWKVLWVLA